MEDRRAPPQIAAIPEELRKKGQEQLEAEISIIEGWLEDLNETREDNPESLAARKSYMDMLRSRKDLLMALRKQ